MDISELSHDRPMQRGAALQIEPFVVRMFSQHRLETLTSESAHLCDARGNVAVALGRVVASQ